MICCNASKLESEGMRNVTVLLLLSRMLFNLIVISDQISMMEFALLRNSSPYEFRTMFLPTRSKRGTPSSISSLRIFDPRAGWEMFNTSAALDIC